MIGGIKEELDESSICRWLDSPSSFFHLPPTAHYNEDDHVDHDDHDIQDDNEDVYRLMFDDTVNAKNGDAFPRAEVEVSGRKINQLSSHMTILYHINHQILREGVKKLLKNPSVKGAGSISQIRKLCWY